jgi:hypothetical protein
MAPRTDTATSVPSDAGAVRVALREETGWDTPAGTQQTEHAFYTRLIEDASDIAGVPGSNSQNIANLPKLSQADLYPVKHAFSL